MKDFTQQSKTRILRETLLQTPIGPMIGLADEKALYLLEFVDRKNLEGSIGHIRQKTQSVIVPGNTCITDLIKKELQSYFCGMLETFTTPIICHGTPFQLSVWRELQNISSGQTYSYKEIALKIHHPNGCRAVAQAMGSNHLAIIIPCHRVINVKGNWGGYSGGLFRKKWLLTHEKTRASFETEVQRSRF